MQPVSLAARIIGGVLLAILVFVLIGFVAGIGPFHRGKSAAEKLQPQVAKSVEKSQGEADAAVNDAADKVARSEASTLEKMDAGADELSNQKIVYRDVPGPTRVVAGKTRVVERRADLPDDAWYRRMCQYQRYAGSETCRRYGGTGAGDGAGQGAGAVRGRAPAARP